MSMLPVLTKLPETHAREIGKVITEYAFLEWRIVQAVYLILGLDPRTGRHAVRKTRLNEYVSLIDDLADIKGIKLKIKTGPIKSHLEHVQSHRDKIAHGIWLKPATGKTPLLQVTSGKWQPDKSKPKVKAVRDPYGVRIRVVDLQQLRQIINQATFMADQLHRAIHAELGTSL